MVRAIRAVPDGPDVIGLDPAVLDTPITDLALSVRLTNLLLKRGVERIGDLRGLTWEAWLDTPNLGRKSVAEFVEELTNLMASASSHETALYSLKLDPDGPINSGPAGQLFSEYGYVDPGRLVAAGRTRSDRRKSRLGLLFLDWLMEDRVPAALTALAETSLGASVILSSDSFSANEHGSHPDPATNPEMPMSEAAVGLVDWTDWRDRLAFVITNLHAKSSLEGLCCLDPGRLAALAEVPEARRELPLGEWDELVRFRIDPITLTKAGLNAVDARRRDILLRTALSEPETQETLEEVSVSFGITRERIRQLRNGALKQFEDRVGVPVRIVGNILRETLGVAFPYTALRDWVAASSSGSEDPALVTAACRAIVNSMGFEIRGGWVSLEDVREMRSHWRTRLRDEGSQHGLVTVEALNEFERMSGISSDFQEAFLLECVELNRFKCKWVRSSTHRDLVQAALAIRGEPSTKDEIAEMTGLDRPTVGAVLSSLDSICRADINRWGFHEWIDDAYQGIGAEIIQRIHESQDGWVEVEEIVEELVDLFEVAASSVRSYFGARRFVTENGRARLVLPAELDSVFWGAIEQEARAVALEDGSWGVLVTVEERHLRGQSFTLPTSLGSAQGLAPDTRGIVPVQGHAAEASVNWNIDTPSNQVTVGRLSELLRTLGVRPGDSVVISPSPTRLRLWTAAHAPVREVVPGIGDETHPSAQPPRPREDVIRDLFRR
ncbi:DNA-directed RNA polymerase subunit alpha C-terminal domain-containing protein [Gaopeijia maritima]|uniref:DNA-directed RNA polymerase subunit alpha C-terminal domain-containing protein n=1 Tax=Gaopeijia maritima TaxID=3119007 RepID=UPI00327D70A5